MKIARLYTLADPRTDEVRYVGWTSSAPGARLSGHLTAARLDRKNHRCAWIRSLMVNGYKPSMRVLAFLESEDAPIYEMAYIEALRSTGTRLVNATDGGDGATGYVPTAEHRAAISRAGLGRKHTPEARAAISAAKLGKERSPETRLKISLAKMGKRPNEEALVAMRLGQLGRKHSPESIEKTASAHRGMKRSPETCAAISRALTGRSRGTGVPKSPEHRAALSRALLGRKLPPRSPDHCAAISRGLLLHYEQLTETLP